MIQYLQITKGGDIVASNLKVIIDNLQTKIKIPSGTRMLVRRSCHAALQFEQYDRQTTIAVTFADNDILGTYSELRVSNFEAPELIAIPSDGSDSSLGRLVISIERILELTKVYDQPFEMGIVYASVHGVFNLLGQFYTDQQAKDALMKKEAEVMGQMGFPPLSDYGRREE